MGPFIDDFSNPELARFYDILPGVGNVIRKNDGLHYTISRGPDGPSSAQYYFTVALLLPAAEKGRRLAR